MKHLQSAIQSVVLLVGFSAFAGSATVTDLSFRQRWPWSEKVDVDYVLAATDTCDVAVFASYEGSGGPVEIPAAAIVGDRINSVGRDVIISRSIRWRQVGRCRSRGFRSR